jgi:hypothetical protein
MKKYCMVLSLAGVMAAQSMYAALTATLTEVAGNANGGGIFQAVTSGNGTFDTFCVSIVTTFSPGTTYDYSLSSTIVANVPPVVPTYIAAGTAYLYNQFRLGNATYAGNLNGNTANEVQATIWYLQGLLVDNGGIYGTGGMKDPENNADLSSLINAILPQLMTDSGLSLAQLEANGNGAYGVLAMNLHDGTIDQPQLAQVPEAATVFAGALLLLPFGASTLRILRRNRMA